MPCKDTFGNTCDRLIRVHIRQVQNVHFDIFKAIACAQKAYGEHGFLFEVASSESVRMNLPSLGKLAVVDTLCDWGRSSGDQAELYRRFGVQDLSAITAFLVQGIAQTATKEVNGCAGHAPHQPAVFLGRDASAWTLAHEVGHVLLSSQFEPVHSPSNRNIMYLFPEHIGTENPEFTTQQVSQMRKSPYALAC